MNLQDVARIFHEPTCGGLITADEAGYFHCAECGAALGWLQTEVLQSLIQVLSRVPEESKGMKRARTVFAYPNGQIAVTDHEGHQVPELQGRAVDVISKVLAECDERTTFHGSIDLKTISRQLEEDFSKGKFHQELIP